MKKRINMVCNYKDINCIHVDTSGMHQTKACEECEHFDHDRVNITRGCAEPSGYVLVAGIVIIIIILVI